MSATSLTQANARLEAKEKEILRTRERNRRIMRAGVCGVAQGINGLGLGIAEAQFGPTWFGIDPALVLFVGEGLLSFFIPDEFAADVVRATAFSSGSIWAYKNGFRMNHERIQRARQRQAAQLPPGTDGGTAPGGSVAADVRQAA